MDGFAGVTTVRSLKFSSDWGQLLINIVQLKNLTDIAKESLQTGIL